MTIFDRKLTIIMLSFIGLTTLYFRLVSHTPNFSPALTLALFSGAFSEKKMRRYGLPLLIMFCTDLILGTHATMPFTYISLLLIAWMGTFIRKHGLIHMSWGALIAPLTFYVISNFGVWIATPLYQKSFDGLIECYVAGIPFFRNSFIGTSLFSLFACLVLVAAHYMIKTRLIYEKVDKKDASLRG